VLLTRGNGFYFVLMTKLCDTLFLETLRCDFTSFWGETEDTTNDHHKRSLRGLKHTWADFCLLKACHNTKPGECFKRFFFHRNDNKACLAGANHWGNIMLEVQQE